ncbi:polysaccharide biosynthesis protein [Anaerorhabdus furcosa]|uniref:NDP-sugar epimerase, includes UDP-GlcNAc-inverting 4,6-dehydratase FlaA1 and capsular polysaccharide biosynthesis protein EpsC n=1 Tax=Anaerorhabdus furcosa TaxID=118967 RepID=A0A1T4NDX5_9FIRM|nr:nucleoside-diphosphate sugar epimerase/dehydratase [Anaerorhabdus furcosa]SJZ77343.1 NDP-sugar epimerase, includes UDP-GlcNAc-inverting 4,6-dehydratase FlaA1 and capsular polysaccharide biosynthesis protein EpsC [Anaerorhabdus furcosa]
MTIRKLRVIALICLDMIVITLSYFLAYVLRFDFKIMNHLNYAYAIFKALPIILLIHLALYLSLGVFRSLWKYVSIEEALLLTISTVVANSLASMLLIIAHFPLIPRGVYIIATILIIVGTIGSRVIYRYLRIQRKSANKNIKSLIIGAGDGGYFLLREINSNPMYENKVIGFIDDDRGKIGRFINGVKILGTCDDIESIVNNYEVKTIFIAIPSAKKEELRRILNVCQKSNVRVRIMSIAEVKEFNKPVIRDVSIEDLLGRGEIHLEQDEISDYIENKVVCVTGAGGSIGSELCRQLLKFKPKQLICFDINENSLYDLQQEIEIERRKNKYYLDTEVIFLIGSIRDLNRLNYVFNKYNPNVLFHAAAHKHVPLMEDSPREAVKNNIFGTLNVVQACIQNKVEKMVLISTDKAVNPTNVMGATKRMCELIIQAYRNNGVTKLGAVRFGNVLGSSGSVIPLFKKQIESGGPVTVTDPEITRYFMTIPEATQLVLQAGVYANKGDIFVLDMGIPVKISKLAEDLIRLSGLRPYEEIEVKYVGLRPGEKMYEELSLGEEIRHKTKNDLIFINEPMDIQLDDLLSKINQLETIMYKDLPLEKIRHELLETIK